MKIVAHIKSGGKKLAVIAKRGESKTEAVQRVMKAHPEGELIENPNEPQSLEPLLMKNRRAHWPEVAEVGKSLGLRKEDLDDVETEFRKARPYMFRGTKKIDSTSGATRHQTSGAPTLSVAPSLKPGGEVPPTPEPAERMAGADPESAPPPGD